MFGNLFSAYYKTRNARIRNNGKRNTGGTAEHPRTMETILHINSSNQGFSYET